VSFHTSVDHCEGDTCVYFVISWMIFFRKLLNSGNSNLHALTVLHVLRHEMLARGAEDSITGVHNSSVVVKNALWSSFAAVVVF